MDLDARRVWGKEVSKWRRERCGAVRRWVLCPLYRVSKPGGGRSTGVKSMTGGGAFNAAVTEGESMSGRFGFLPSQRRRAAGVAAWRWWANGGGGWMRE
jgi:hypothetical protein